jgi:hypothetical protein
VVGGGLPCGGFFQLGAAICSALSIRLGNRFSKYFGARVNRKLEPEKIEPLDKMLTDQREFWMGILSGLSAKASTPITELRKMDVFDFFALLSVVEKQQDKK